MSVDTSLEIFVFDISYESIEVCYCKIALGMYNQILCTASGIALLPIEMQNLAFTSINNFVK